MSNTILNTDFLQPKDAWDELPLQQKAEMMRVAIRNGIHDLPTIRQKYNEFAEGGIMEENLYAKGGPKKQYGNAGSQKAMQFFMNKGLTQAQAAGLVGNLMRESGMQSTALNSSSKAYGIAQWLGPRKKALFAKYGSNPTFDQQLDFVWHELNTTHKNGLRHLKASKTAAEAARNVMGYYEFSAGPEAAIAAMNRTGQAGNKSMQIGIENASKLLGVPVPTGEYVQQEVPVTTEIPKNTFQFTPWNPQVFYGNQAYQAPQIELPLEQAVPETTPIVTQEQLEKAEKQQGLDTFAALSNLFQPSSSTINTSNVLVNPQKRTNPYVAYQNGGNLFDGGGRRDVYNNKRIYDILPKLYALDGVNTALSSGKRPGSVVIENGKSTGRVSRHASGQAADIVPGKGSTFADMFRVLRDPNSHVSRYLQSLGGGYIDETSATGTTKYWHDHDRDHSHIHHQIGGGAASKYKSEIASILKGNAPAVASTQAAFPTFDFVPSNPQAFFTPIENFQQPIERPVIQAPTTEDLAREQRMQEIEERRENLNRFGLLLGLSSPSQGDNSLMQTIGLLSNNMSAHGGHIHIAPSKKGTFTAAATKHGMGVQEFASKVLAHPENYSPAMRKKANFARNASKWHGLGGNLYDLGGDTVGEWINTIYQNNPKEDYLGEPAHHYDFTQSEEWANVHGYYPDARGHRDDRVKKPAHPSHSSRGVWDGDKFVLSELGMQNPNYTLFGLNDGGQDPQATLIYKGGNVIPETTVTPSGNYIFNPYDNIKIKFANGGHLYDGTTEPTQQMDNSYTYYKPLENIFVDSEGNLRDPEVPRARGTIQLPEVTVSMRDPRKPVPTANVLNPSSLSLSNLLDKDKVYNRIPGDEWYNVVNEDRKSNYGISGPFGALQAYFSNDDDYVLNRLSRYMPYKDMSWREKEKAAQDFYEEGRRVKYKFDTLSDTAKHRLEMLQDKSEALPILQHEDAKAVYLGLPQRTNTLRDAEYTPTQGKLNNGKYITYMREPTFVEDVLMPIYNDLKLGRKRIDGKKVAGEVLSLPKYVNSIEEITPKGNAVVHIPFLNNATMSSGHDDRGEYLSIFDTWDYNTGVYAKPGDNIGKHIDGRPFDIYDRIYLDDYYNIPDEYKGSSYLPEATVYGKKKKP